MHYAASDVPKEPPPPAPSDRSTTFQPATGGKETYSGGTLLVSAYGVLWFILLGWLFSMWRKQRALDVRLHTLETKIRN